MKAARRSSFLFSRVRNAQEAVSAIGADTFDEAPDAWERYVNRLSVQGIPAPGVAHDVRRKPATVADEQALYDVGPSFVDLLPWVEHLPGSQCMLLDDGESVAAFFELTTIGTEGRDGQWLAQARDAIENALQDSFEELDDHPWVVQLYVQDETDWATYLRTLHEYVHARAKDTAFTRFYLRLFQHHLQAVSKPGGLFHDNTVTRLPWRGQTRRVRMVIYRRVHDFRRAARTPGVSNTSSRRGPSPEDALGVMCDRMTRGLSNAGIRVRRLQAADIHAWLLRWFNPRPTLLGTSPEDQERFYRLAAYPEEREPGQLELASGVDFAQRLFFGQPRSDVDRGVWYFDGLPHRVIVLDRLRKPPAIGHVTGEAHTSSDAVSAVFDQLPEGTVMCMTLLVTPQDTLEAHLNYLGRKSVGDTLDSEQTRQDLQQARSILRSAHKLYRGAVAFYVRGHDLEDLDERTRQVTNVMLAAGLQPVREEDEVAPLNSYLRWLPCVYDPAKDRRAWYTQLMFAQHVANLGPFWGRSQGTGHPGITFFNRGGGLVCFDPFNRADRQMNAHLFLFGPTGSGKSATLNNLLVQSLAIYRPRLFILEAGNSFGLFGEFAERLGLTVHRVKLAPGSGVTLAPFADARRLVETPAQVETIDADAIDEPGTASNQDSDEKRDVLGELEITARLMITGGEEREESRTTRADRSLIRQCILDAARRCTLQRRVVLTQDVRDALRARGNDPLLPEIRRTRLLEMADAMDMFCQGVNGQLFNRAGTSWPEADITLVDLATFAREGYNAELSIAYISLVNTVNDIAERDQFLGRPTCFVVDEGHIVLKNPLLSPFSVKATKMWRKLGLWFWLSTQNLDDFPAAAQPMLSMIEWWICLSMPPDEVEKVARFRELNAAQKRLLRSARKESGKFSEGVVLSKSMEVLFRAVLPSINLALAMTDPEEKNERYKLMMKHGLGELDAALRIAEAIDHNRGIEPVRVDALR
jgi:conjugative transfer ATPase